MLSKISLLGLMAILALTACAPVPIRTQRELPPAALVQDCPVPLMDVGTNGSLARTILAYKGALATCNNDKAALREWMKE